MRLSCATGLGDRRCLSSSSPFFFSSISFSKRSRFVVGHCGDNSESSGTCSICSIDPCNCFVRGARTPFARLRGKRYGFSSRGGAVAIFNSGN